MAHVLRVSPPLEAGILLEDSPHPDTMARIRYFSQIADEVGAEALSTTPKTITAIRASFSPIGSPTFQVPQPGWRQLQLGELLPPQLLLLLLCLLLKLLLVNLEEREEEEGGVHVVTPKN